MVMVMVIGRKEGVNSEGVPEEGGTGPDMP